MSDAYSLGYIIGFSLAYIVQTVGQVFIYTRVGFWLTRRMEYGLKRLFLVHGVAAIVVYFLHVFNSYADKEVDQIFWHVPGFIFGQVFWLTFDFLRLRQRAAVSAQSSFQAD